LHSPLEYYLLQSLIICCIEYLLRLRFPLIRLLYSIPTQFTSAIFIWINNILADSCSNSSIETCYIKWTLYDFTPWAFVSTFVWVPGGTAGVYAIRHAGLAVSNGIVSCVVVMSSFIWGVFIFREKQKSTFGALMSVALLCAGLCGISYFSSRKVGTKKQGRAQGHRECRIVEQGVSPAGEATPLKEKGENDNATLDFPAGMPPHCHQTIDLHLPSLPATPNKCVYHESRYHLGLCMAVVNGVLASLMFLPLHYAPPHSTDGLGYSTSFGIAAVFTVMFFWMLRFIFLSLGKFIGHSSWPNSGSECRGTNMTWRLLRQIITDSCCEGYRQLPPLHIRVMWKAGMTSGMLYSLGNAFGIMSIKKLGNFMGYSLNQSSMIISGEQACIIRFNCSRLISVIQSNLIGNSYCHFLCILATGLWGIFYYREIPGAMNIIGFLSSTCVVFSGILLMASEHK
jgi:glucose uptake protein GlcU